MDYSKVTEFGGKHFICTNPDDAEHVLHVVRSGHPDVYYAFWEDAHELEPIKSGIMVLSIDELRTEYSIVLPS